MPKIIRDGLVFSSSNSKDIEYNSSKNVLSLKTNNVQDTIDEVSSMINDVKNFAVEIDKSQITKDYVNKTISSKISENNKTMSSNYITKSEANSTYAKKTDLNNYATKSNISNLASKTDLNYYLKKTDASNYATKNDISNIASKTDLNNYAKKTDLSIYLKNTDLNNYATKTDLNAYSKKTDLNNYTTKTELSNTEKTINNKLKVKVSYYNCVADMKKDTFLSEGVHIVTLGYSYCNDTGGAKYYISKSIPTNRPYELLNNGLYAVMIIEPNNTVNVISLGMNRFGSADCSSILNKYISYKISSTLYFPSGAYLFKSPITVPKGLQLKIIGNTENYNKHDEYINSKNEAYSAYCESVLYFNTSTKDSTFITVSGGVNEFSVKNITFVSNSGRFSKKEYKERNSSAQHLYSYTSKVSNISCISNNSASLKIDTCKFIGFSGTAMTVTYNNNISNCIFKHCNLAINCVSSDLTINNCNISMGNNGIYTNKAYYIKIINVDISTLIMHGVYSTTPIGECRITGRITDIEYAAISFFSVITLSLDVFIMKCGSYYSGSDIKNITKNGDWDAKIAELKKASSICISYLSHAVIIYRGYRARLDPTIDKYASPCVHFCGIKWSNSIIIGMNGDERSNVKYFLDGSSKVSIYTCNQVIE